MKNFTKIGYWLAGAGVFMLGVSIALNVSQTTITNEGIVLGFIGVLATFIVVGNYAQVMQIKSETENKIAEMENRNELQVIDLKEDLTKKQIIINKSLKEIEDLKKRAIEILQQTGFSAGEIHRMYGSFCLDKELYRNAVMHFVTAIIYYQTSTIDTSEMIDNLLKHIYICLDEENWNKNKENIKYIVLIDTTEKLNSSVKEKDEIIELIKERQREEECNNI